MAKEHGAAAKKRLGENITKAAAACGIPKTELARQIEVTYRTLAAWCAGRSWPLEHNLHAIADVCGVSVQWLKTGKGAPPVDRMHVRAPDAMAAMTERGARARVVSVQWDPSQRAWVMDIRITFRAGTVKLRRSP